ncbi:MAG: acyl-ACP--UDP-N-acetylglucosamine O-acyltransferase [Rickettsiales bacterium]
MPIHPTAVIAGSARIDETAHVGPYCVVGDDSAVGAGVVLQSHVVIGDRTHIGANCRLHPFSVVGGPPQDLKYHGEPSRTIIGDGTVVRECATVNGGTEGGIMETRVGKNCLLMTSCHVAHDCRVGDGVVMANNATLAGHVVVGDRAVIGGLAAVHQFVRIGEYAMIGGLAGVERDVIPYGLASGDRAFLAGLNLVGLKRGGFDKKDVQSLLKAFAELFDAGEDATLKQRTAETAQRYADNPLLARIVAFMERESERGLCRPKNGDAAGAKAKTS